MIANLLKAGLLTIYAMALTGWAGLLPSALAGTVENIAIILLVIHALEAVLMFKHVRLYRGSLWVSLLLTLLFGLLHWKPLADAQARSKTK